MKQILSKWWASELVGADEGLSGMISVSYSAVFLETIELK